MSDEGTRLSDWRQENYRINAYTCPSMHRTVTVDVDRGVTPFRIGCAACSSENVDGFVSAESACYLLRRPVPPEFPRPTMEWYNPGDSCDEYTQLSLRPIQTPMAGWIRHSEEVPK